MRNFSLNFLIWPSKVMSFSTKNKFIDLFFISFLPMFDDVSGMEYYFFVPFDKKVKFLIKKLLYLCKFSILTL